MVLTQRAVIKYLDNPMIFSKSKRDSNYYTIKPKSHKNKDFLFFTQGVFNFHMKRWELYIEVSHGSLARNSMKINQKLNGKLSRS